MNPPATETHPGSVQSPGSSRRPRVKVVGYDGSPTGRDVVEGAARRAAPNDRLIIVHVLEPESLSTVPLASRYRQAWETMLSALDPEVLDGIDYELRVVAGPPAQVLINVAHHCGAAAIVIGTGRAPSRFGQRTVRSELEFGPVPVVALVGTTDAEPIDAMHRHGLDSFPASDPPSSWSGPPRRANASQSVD